MNTIPKESVCISDSKSEIKLEGTGFATPGVAGAVALMVGSEPGLSNNEIKSRLANPAVPEQPLHHPIFEEVEVLGGSGFAAPLVSGAVALLISSEPGITNEEVKNRLSQAQTESGEIDLQKLLG